MDVCSICSKEIESKDVGVNVFEKGLTSLMNASLVRKDQKLQEFFQEKLAEGSAYLHKDCRKRYIDLRKVEIRLEPQVKKSRTSMDKFDWKVDCFFCGEECAKQSHSKNPSRQNFRQVETLELRENILKSIGNSEDPYFSQIRHRLLNCIDLVSVEAVYHYKCYTSFFLNKKDDSKIRKSRGRPVDQQMHQAFEKSCQWFESIDGATTLKEFLDVMKKTADDEHICSVTWLKQKLIEKYQSSLHITTDGYRCIIALKEKIENIINEMWYKERCKNIEDEKKRIILTAAKLIKAEIQLLSDYNKEFYPEEDKIASKDEGEKWLPESLVKFLGVLVPSLVKRISIGESICYAARPNYAFPPVLFGLAVELDHVFGSRWLVEHLSHLGFCISYYEVVKYKQSVLQSERAEVHVAVSQPQFAQWSADNVDHNIVTLDGKNTFHGMGIIVSAISDENNVVASLPPVQRKNRIHVGELSQGHSVPISQYEKPTFSGLSIELKKLIELLQFYEVPQEIASLNALWHLGWLFNSTERKHLNWSGYMQSVDSRLIDPVVSNVHLLPIIDMDPGNATCIYSTLLYVIQQASNLNILTPCITFDQPLWLKATDIVNSKSLKVVVRLGGFHMLMSFLGSIGITMEGSGLKEAFGEVYASNVIPHMLSGKAYARALRGHFLVHAALMYKIYQQMIDEMESLDVQEIKDVLDGVLNKRIYREDIKNIKILQRVC